MKQSYNVAVNQKIALVAFVCLPALLTIGCGGTDSEKPSMTAAGGTGAELGATGGVPAGSGDGGGQVEPMTSGNGGESPAIEAPGTVATLADDLMFPARFTLDDENVYVANRPGLSTLDTPDQVLVVPIHGGEARVLAEFESISTLLSVEDEVWVLGLTDKTLSVVSKATGETTQSIPLTTSPLAVARTEAEVLFAGGSPLNVTSISLETKRGGIPWTLGSNFQDQPFTLFADPSGVLMTTYFRLGEALEYQSKIYAMDTSAAEPRILLERDGVFPAVRAAGDQVLFTDNTQGTVEVVPRAGGEPTKLLDLEYAWMLGADADYVYATARPDLTEESPLPVGKLVRFKHDGTGLEVLAEGLLAPSMLEVTADAVYWVNSGDARLVPDMGATSNGQGSLMRYKK